MAERKSYDVTARRDGRWWFVYVPDLDTAGQAAKLSEIDDVAREVIGLFLDVDPHTFDVRVHVELPEDVRAAWEESKAKAAAAREQEAAAAALARRAVVELRSSYGLTLVDAGTLLGVSTQRIHQLEKPRTATSDSESPRTRSA